MSLTTSLPSSKTRATPLQQQATTCKSRHQGLNLKCLHSSDTACTAQNCMHVTTTKYDALLCCPVGEFSMPIPAVPAVHPKHIYMLHHCAALQGSGQCLHQGSGAGTPAGSPLGQQGSSTPGPGPSTGVCRGQYSPVWSPGVQGHGMLIAAPLA
jgi:hypothetical protein